MEIIQFIEDPNLINDHSLSLPQKVALKAVYGLPLNPKERNIYRLCTGLKKYKPKEYCSATFICGRRSGKTDKLASNMAIFEATSRDHDKHLSTGEKGYVVLVAVNKKQARILYTYILGKLQASPILSSMIANITAEEIELNNQICIAIYPCSMRTIRGISTVFFCGEETSFWKLEGVDVDREVINSVKPSLIQFPYSKLIKISTPYTKRGVVYEDFRDHFGKNSDVLVWQASSSFMNPTISEKMIKKEIDKDFAFASAEYLARFRSDLETFLSTEMLEATIVPGRWELPRIDGAYYHAFVDSSGGRSASFALAIAHRDENTGKIIVDRIEERRPPLAPQTVINEFSEIVKSYNTDRVIGDRYAAEFTVEAFRKCGICYESSALDKSGLYLEFEPLVAQGIVELLDNQRLFNQLRSLERRTRSCGKDRVDHPPFTQDDIANVVAGTCVICQAHNQEYSDLVLRTFAQDVNKKELTDEERFTKWLLGGELEPPEEQEGDKPIIGEKKTAMVISELDRTKR